MQKDISTDSRVKQLGFDWTQTLPYYFPHPKTADKQGLLAIGGDLHPFRVLQAYRQGIFPWFEPGNPILWWSPNPRLVLYPGQLKVSRSLKHSLRKPWHIQCDRQFDQVILHCAMSNGRDGNTWLTESMIDCYNILHKMGFAHSVEVLLEGKLVGGLYGINFGAAFFGESMFHLVTDASKVALYALCKITQRYNFHFIDCQLPNTHLEKLGATLVKREAFLHELELSNAEEDRIKDWQNIEVSV